MTKEDFFGKIKTILSVEEICAASGDKSLRYNYNFGKKSEYQFDVYNCIGVQWVTGGRGGGSCWNTGEDTSNHFSLQADREPELESLGKILNVITPNITYMQYKRLTHNVLKFYSYSRNDYYGNSTDNTIKFINLNNLFDYLKTEKFI